MSTAINTYTKMAQPIDRWVAIRRGPIYCAPACGGGCTWEAYQRAFHAAKNMAASLGPGWFPRVWENLGWHWEVRRGPLTVCAHPRGSLMRYSTILWGFPTAGNVKFYRTGHAAVRARIREAEAHVGQLVAVLDEAKGKA